MLPLLGKLSFIIGGVKFDTYQEYGEGFGPMTRQQPSRLLVTSYKLPVTNRGASNPQTHDGNDKFSLSILLAKGFFNFYQNFFM